ncbi:MAG: hypothetical protein PHY16_19800 [Methylobacter sp.]|nr:hypothetical protein [Methylobacter sp.]
MKLPRAFLQQTVHRNITFYSVVGLTILIATINTTYASTFYIDQFSVSRQGFPTFSDTFNTGNPPPAGPLGEQNAYITTPGAFPAGSESSGKLTMDPIANGVPSFNGGLAVGATLNQSISALSPFSINGVFEYGANSRAISSLMGVDAFEINYIGTNPTPTGNLIYALLGYDALTGQQYVAAAEANYLQNVFTPLNITPVSPVGSDQVVLSLSSTGSGAIDAAYQYFDGTTPIGTASTFYTYGAATPFYDPGFTVGATVPVPPSYTLMLLGMSLFGFITYGRQRTG